MKFHSLYSTSQSCKIYCLPRPRRSCKKWERDRKDKRRCMWEEKNREGRLNTNFLVLIARRLSYSSLANCHTSAYRARISAGLVFICDVLCGLAGHHGSVTPGAEGEDCRAGGQFPGGEEQAGRRGVQVGWQWKWHHRSGQADVYDHDGDDGLHQVRANLPLRILTACQRPRERAHTPLRLNPIGFSGMHYCFGLAVPAQWFSFILVCMAVHIAREMCPCLFWGRTFC